MDNALTTIKFHGDLGEKLGRDIWELSVKSVGEAMRAVEQQTKKLYRTLMDHDKQNIKYKVLINGKNFVHKQGKDINKLEGIEESELVLKRKIETIDIIPIIEGAGDSFRDIFTIILAVVLIVVGFYIGGPLGSALIMSGIGLAAAGIANLLTPMPEFDDFRQIEGGGRPSYLFTGPANTIREGGPVFVGYGRLLIGSHVIQSSLETFDEKNGRSSVKLLEDGMKPTGPTKYYWGNEIYGLDYRNRIKDKSGQTVNIDDLMATRAETVSSSSGGAADCDPTDLHVSKVEAAGGTVLIANGDDFTTANVVLSDLP